MDLRALSEGRYAGAGVECQRQGELVCGDAVEKHEREGQDGVPGSTASVAGSADEGVPEERPVVGGGEREEDAAGEAAEGRVGGGEEAAKEEGWVAKYKAGGDEAGVELTGIAVGSASGEEGEGGVGDVGGRGGAREEWSHG